MPQVVQTEVKLEAPESLWAEFDREQGLVRAASTKAIAGYYNNPVAFMHDCVAWPEGSGPTEYQDETWASIPTKKKVSLRSLHSAGKTTTDALALWWFAITREASGVDWKAPATAGAWRQLEKYLYPEVHKWSRLIRWDKLGMEPWVKGKGLLDLAIKGQHGSAFAVAASDPSLIEGAHADSLFFIYDEAKAIHGALFDASEGAFAGTGEAFALSSSTPGEPVGRFYDIQSQKSGYDDWHVIHISLDRAVAAGRVSRAWAEQRALQWGEHSALYANRVLGEFHSSDEDAVIPLSWVEAAVERWHASREVRGWVLPAMTSMGIDVARSGDDQSVMAPRHGHRYEALHYSHHRMINETANTAHVLLVDAGSPTVTVDTDGLGAGVTDRLRELGHTVVAFHAGAKTDMKDESGELCYRNSRSAAWWQLRQALDPSKGAVLELPPDELLTGDLSAPHWDTNDKSQIYVESKDEIKKRIGRSTDSADAVVMDNWEPPVVRRRQMTFAGHY